jgi:hypothetical protein
MMCQMTIYALTLLRVHTCALFMQMKVQKCSPFRYYIWLSLVGWVRMFHVRFAHNTTMCTYNQ